MKERRSLIEGLKPDPELQKVEEAFVFGAKRKPESVNESPIAEPIIVPVPVAVEFTSMKLPLFSYFRTR